LFDIDRSFNPIRWIAVDALPPVGVDMVLFGLLVAKGESLFRPPWFYLAALAASDSHAVDEEVIPSTALLVEV
jgi:hypothetical protein